MDLTLIVWIALKNNTAATGQEGGVIFQTNGGRDADPYAAQKSVHGCIHSGSGI